MQLCALVPWLFRDQRLMMCGLQSYPCLPCVCAAAPQYGALIRPDFILLSNRLVTSDASFQSDPEAQGEAEGQQGKSEHWERVVTLIRLTPAQVRGEGGRERAAHMNECRTFVRGAFAWCVSQMSVCIRPCSRVF